MKSKTLHVILKLLIALAGAGIGVALVLSVLFVVKLANPDITFDVAVLGLIYVGSALLFALLLWLFSERIIQGGSALVSQLLGKLDDMPVTSLLPSISGLIVGLVIAALLCNILQFMGDSIFTTAFSAMLYLILGALGYTIGHRRAADLNRSFQDTVHGKSRRYRLKKGNRRVRHSDRGSRLPDLSALTDGRLAEICRTGFLEGVLLIPDFLLEELRRLANSPDAAKKARGERGQAILEALRAMPGVTLQVVSTESDTDDPDVRLLRLARKTGAALITCDQSLARSAEVSGIRVLSINRLNEALRLNVSAGDSLEVTLVKPGRESHQGVAYLPDGTMVVCENAAALIGQTVTVIVSSALQTSAGRMVFARVKEGAA